MYWLNRYEIETMGELVALVEQRQNVSLPNVKHAAACLTRLMRWTDDRSDGWPYWKPPARSAGALMQRLEDWRQTIYTGGTVEDVPAVEVSKVLRPVRKFVKAQECDPDVIAPLKWEGMNDE